MDRNIRHLCDYLKINVALTLPSLPTGMSQTCSSQVSQTRSIAHSHPDVEYVDELQERTAELEDFSLGGGIRSY